MSPIILLKNEKALRGSWQKLWCSTMDCLNCNTKKKKLISLFSNFVPIGVRIEYDVLLNHTILRTAVLLLFILMYTLEQ